MYWVEQEEKCEVETEVKCDIEIKEKCEPGKFISSEATL